MASRSYKQFLYSNNPGLTYVEGSFRIGVGGAVMANSFVGNGLWASSTNAVVKRGGGSGIYQLQLADNFARLVGMEFELIPAPSSAGVRDGSGNILTNGRAYQIVAVGTSGGTEGGSGTDWSVLGLPANITPAPGVVFVPTSGASNATSGGIGAGSGVLQLLGISGLSHVELLPGMNSGQLFPSSALYGTGATRAVAGGSIWFQTRLSSSAVPVNATCGTTIRFNAFLRNSSLLNVNETTGTTVLRPTD